MNSRIYAFLLLILFPVQLCRGANEHCPEAVKSIQLVENCPSSKEEWEDAASIKNCSKSTGRQNCTTAEEFLYHCVINAYINETLEVCAPKRLIHGSCTEFNVAGGIIQTHKKVLCKTCPAFYRSTEAFKYPECYQLVYNARGKNTTLKPTESTPDNTINRDAIIIGAVVTVIILVILVTILLLMLKRRHNKRKACKTQREEHRISLLETGDADQEEDLSKETKDTGIKKNTERKLLVRKDTKVTTTTDKYAFAVLKTDKELREENKDESEKYLKGYRTMDKYFLETAIYKKAEEIFDKNGIVILTGPPGCGKTIAAIHMILKAINQKDTHWTFRKIHSWDELQYVDDDDEHALVFIDNIFFRSTLDMDLENWWNELERIYKQYFAVRESEIESLPVRIVMTARQNVVERACSFMERVTPVLNRNFLIDASALLEIEKEQIFLKQIEFAKKERNLTDLLTIDTEFKTKMRESEGPIGFPLCANLYVCGKEYRKSGASFFSRPIDYLKLQIKDEIEGDKSNKTKSLFFCLFFDEWHTKMGHFESIQIQNESLCRQCLDKVSRNIIPNFEPFDFRELESEAQRLSGAFFKRIGENEYKFVHDSVYEAVETYLCETYVTESAKYFPLHIIQNQHYENLTERQMLTFTARFLYEILEQHISHVFMCKLYQNRHFVDCFCAELEKKDQKTINSIFTIANESSIVKLPCVFWSSRYNLSYLTELLYDIVKRRGITPQYQLYVLLYGVCCARSEGLLKTINGMLYDKLDMIQKRVLEFQDSDGNSILHLLVISDFSDEFVSTAVEQILTEKTSVGSKNNLRITPLMFAVEQILPRGKVIKTILKFSKQLLKKDSTGSTILHHCLASNHDDKTCAEYLEIILKDSCVGDLIAKDDVKGDTALSTAANCSKHSRIRSILLLLKNNANIINTINEDGYSALHLSVGCFKHTRASLVVELECCVRVIVLILYGASPDKESDDKNKAVDACKYDLVRGILRNPKDTKSMENALETLLEKLNWTQTKELPEKTLSLPANMSAGIKKCISNAVHHLESCRIDHQL